MLFSINRGDILGFLTCVAFVLNLGDKGQVVADAEGCLPTVISPLFLFHRILNLFRC